MFFNEEIWDTSLDEGKNRIIIHLILRCLKIISRKTCISTMLLKLSRVANP